MRKVAVFLLVSLGLGLDYSYATERLSAGEVFGVLALGATLAFLMAMLVRSHESTR